MIRYAAVRSCSVAFVTEGTCNLKVSQSLRCNWRSVSAGLSPALHRITSRPWAADSYLKETISRLVFGRHSACMLVEHSEVHKRTFQSYVDAMHRIEINHPTGASAIRIRSLKACKVRFESCTKPMGRFVLYFQAIVSTLIKVRTTRVGRKEATAADGQLEFLDNERVLTVAMMADAGDEALQLCRYYDTGRHNPGEAERVHDEFRVRIDFLFVWGVLAIPGKSTD